MASERRVQRVWTCDVRDCDEPVAWGVEGGTYLCDKHRPIGADR